jgi:hypothetical protein
MEVQPFFPGEALQLFAHKCTWLNPYRTLLNPICKSQLAELRYIFMLERAVCETAIVRDTPMFCVIIL